MRRRRQPLFLECLGVMPWALGLEPELSRPDHIEPHRALNWLIGHQGQE